MNNSRNDFRRTWPALACAALLGACADRPPLSHAELGADLRAEVAAVNTTTARAPVAAPAPVAPPAPAPARPPAPPEPRFDLIVNGANVRDVFLSMVADTPYSMMMHPEVTGTLSVTLRSVTVAEALESIRDVYGYDFQIEGRRITVYPATQQTRIFTVNYPTANRRGRSEVHVTSSSAPTNNTSGSSNGNTTATPTQSSAQIDSSQITTNSNSDFWGETAEALRGLVGKGGVVITSPQAGTIAVRAMPDELRQVEKFLRASRLAVERQVMLEAKIVEVELRDGFQSGIDWSLLRNNAAAGQTSGVPSNALVQNPNGLPTLQAVPNALATLLTESLGLPMANNATFGLSLAKNGFQALLAFLEAHGEVQVLSSPRVATLNNQKAVLKVGVDEYFITNVSGGSITPGNNATNGTANMPSLTLTPFFSGIALDVTPQIDEANMITLHLRPSVTTVTEKTKNVDLGVLGNYRLPMASSSVNETDTVVRVPDGNIVAIGGLMHTESSRKTSGLPGSSESAIGRTLLGNNENTGLKKELVVLIKPTIIRSTEDWQRSTELALANFDQRPQRTIVVNPPVAAAAPPPAAVPAPPPEAAPQTPPAAANAAPKSTAAAPAPAAARPQRTGTRPPPRTTRPAAVQTVRITTVGQPKGRARKVNV
jgi:MSHA biogenesis protein MshL